MNGYAAAVALLGARRVALCRAEAESVVARVWLDVKDAPYDVHAEYERTHAERARARRLYDMALIRVARTK